MNKISGWECVKLSIAGFLGLSLVVGAYDILSTVVRIVL